MNPLASALSAIALASLAAPFAVADGQFDRTLTISGQADLDVSTDAGGISVTTGSPGVVRIHAILKLNTSWFGPAGSEERIRQIERNPPIEQSGNRIRIGHMKDPDLLRGISMRLEIQTPPETRLHATADSGGIRVEGIRGPAECQTDSGGIHIRNIAGAVVAHADSGGVEAFDIAGPIEAHTDSGGIRLSQTKAASIQAEADSGGVALTLASGAGYDLDVETDSGRISVPDATQSSESSSHRVEGKLRGGGAKVVVRADSGSVSID